MVGLSSERGPALLVSEWRGRKEEENVWCQSLDGKGQPKKACVFGTVSLTESKFTSWVRHSSFHRNRGVRRQRERTRVPSKAFPCMGKVDGNVAFTR